MNNKFSITVVGTGYVGLVTGACFAELGFDVTCLDKDRDKILAIQQGLIPIYEPGLASLVEKNLAANRLHFDITLKHTLETSDIIFIAVGTPTHPMTGEADLCFVESVAEELAPWLNNYKTIVVKSTVPVGTGQRINKIIRACNPKALFSMVSNPEFLREGSAVFDFMNPDRIIVGSDNPESRKHMDSLYQSFVEQGISIVHTNIETAEMIKYAANCFLATKIAFVNEIASLCEKLSADVESVMLGVGLDQRIGSGYLKPGPGYGGSCFPKDTLALCYAAVAAGAPLSIIEAVVHSNETRKREMITKIISACGGSVQDKTLCILGLAFKANTDDVRDSAALTITQGLQAEGAKIQAFDPEAMEKASQFLTDVLWAKDAYQAIKGSAAVIIVTEWEEFGNLDLNRVKKQMLSTSPILIDLRNLYHPKTVTDAGLSYVSIGRTQAFPDSLKSENSESSERAKRTEKAESSEKFEQSEQTEYLEQHVIS